MVTEQNTKKLHIAFHMLILIIGCGLLLFSTFLYIFIENKINFSIQFIITMIIAFLSSILMIFSFGYYIEIKNTYMQIKFFNLIINRIEYDKIMTIDTVTFPMNGYLFKHEVNANHRSNYFFRVQNEHKLFIKLLDNNKNCSISNDLRKRLSKYLS